MQSFRTELENPVVEQDIIDLEKKIRLFHEGNMDEEKFRSLRLARGVYGQRQPGVQMVRIKIPYGKLTVRQLRRIADISDEYASSNLHITTRQDIQIHYVSLDRTPELWAKLEQDQITLREACGNTVRNITASHTAGIDPEEAFDVSPYAQGMFEYLLRNPVCQEMGRKFKIAFSSSEADSAFTFIHDIGFIPKIKTENGKGIRGFKVVIGGGLGAQPQLAEVAYEFLSEEKIMPFAEALLRVFDRYGERNRRQKARFKFLLKEEGLENILKMVEDEWESLPNKEYWFNHDSDDQLPTIPEANWRETQIKDEAKFNLWKETNVFEQKQVGFYGVNLKVLLGDMSSDLSRKLADVVEKFAGDDMRLTINQNISLRFVRPEALPHLYNALEELGLTNPGFDSTADITACPGTDTCNLGISSSTGISKTLEHVITQEYPEMIKDNHIKIKISGCPNSCGQHGIATIGYHGSSMKKDGLIMPALQVLLGGKIGWNGTGTIAEKVIKIPSKRGPQSLRVLLEDYDNNKQEGEYFADYYWRQGKMYFYALLKPLADTETLTQDDFIDWGSEDAFAVHKAVGECASVIIDLVATLLFETEEKYTWAEEAFAQEAYADAVYHAYNVFLNGAKALLLNTNAKTNTQSKILKEFDKHFGEEEIFPYERGFEAHVLQMRQNEPTEKFAKYYIEQAQDFLKRVNAHRENQLEKEATLA